MKRSYKAIVLMMLLNIVTVNVLGVQSKKNKSTQKILLNVPMHCETCQAKIEKNIAFEKGVKDMVIDAQLKTVEITFDTTKTNLKTLEAAFRKIGYEVTPK
jgi:mercuric ion binding protein